MGFHTTVVFTDLAGSTGLFESLGNDKATETVTRLNRWISEVIEAHAGQVVKNLGDGVLGTFADPADAVTATLEIQRGHQIRLARWPASLRTEIKIGVASGEVLVVDGDCYGDAVNVAARLSDMSGPSEIWITETTLDGSGDIAGLRFHSLGPVSIRGRSEMLPLCQIEWHEEVVSNLMTMQASLPEIEPQDDPIFGRIELSWSGGSLDCVPNDLPLHLGRVAEAELCIPDPRVSRLHARIDWRSGAFVLVDISSFGTWLRFDGSDAEIQLRREECILHGNGEISLGVPFVDATAPLVRFSIASTRIFRQRRPDFGAKKLS